MKVYIVLMHSRAQTQICAAFNNENNAVIYAETQAKLCGHYYTYTHEEWHLLDTEYEADNSSCEELK